MQASGIYPDLPNNIEAWVSAFSLFLSFFFFFLAALGLRCCAQPFSSCGEQGLLSVVVLGLLIAVASLIVEHGL